MLISVLAVIIGLALLVFSADKFVDGAVGVARFCGMSTLLIGMVIVGFGTSAPELVVSVFSAVDNAPELALGNAYGSNIANIALILGITAIITPVLVKRDALRFDMPVLVLVSLLSLFLLLDGNVSRMDAAILLLAFAGIMTFSIVTELKKSHAVHDEEKDENVKPVSIGKSIFLLVFGLVFLVLSSRALVWGACNIAKSLGVSDLLIGLTIVAVGTSLPELASSIMAARKGEDDLAFGNIIGSNLFNTLAVVGLASVISPMKTFDEAVLYRDLPVMLALTVLLFVFGIPTKLSRKNAEGKRIGRINRLEGSAFLVVYIGYIVYLIVQALGLQ